jgi:hypothetical protein
LVFAKRDKRNEIKKEVEKISLTILDDCDPAKHAIDAAERD